jgi:N-acetylneuraminic acid mutarotase
MSLTSRFRPALKSSAVLESLESRALLCAVPLEAHESLGLDAHVAGAIDTSGQSAFEAKVNFQPAASPVPAGYVADGGAVFGDRGAGLSYGWNAPNANYARDRNDARSPDQRYDTVNQMQRAGGGTVWEIAVPNGTYSVRIVAGDAGAYDSNYAISAEGTTVVSGKPTSVVRWYEGTKSITVTDGRLTVTSAAGSANNKICFIDIRQEGGSDLPAVSVTASDPSAAEAGPDAGTFVVSREGDTTAPLTVHYAVGGTATAGADYAALSGSAVIPAGASSAVLTVNPVDDAAAEAGETVILTLAPAATYNLSGASATVSIADNDGPTTGFSTNVNFQPASAPVPAGYVADTGAVFASRGNGLAYGWNLANAGNARDRNAANAADQRYDTLNHMQKSGGGTVWEIAVPNGNYSVHVVAGDAFAYDSTYAINAEGVLVVSGKPTSAVRWLEGTQSVTVADGQLTISNAAGSANNKIAFIDITADSGVVVPRVSISASDPSASEAAGNPGSFTVTRTGQTSEPLVVNLAVGGSAVNGTDYDVLGTSVTIPAGATSATLAVRPVDDAATEPTETVTLGVAPGGGYTVGSPATANVSIADNDAAPGTTITWREVAPVSVGRSEGMGAVVGGKLYVFGGYVDTTFKPTRRSDVYDVATNRWSQIADLPFGSSHVGTTVVGNSIYFAGGYPATATNQTFSTDAVWRYDTTTNTFSDMPKLPAPRGGAALVALGRTLHFFGGSDRFRTDAAQHWSLDLDNLAAGWVARAPLPVATNHVAGVALGGKIYAIGGQQKQDAAAVQRADVQVYDPATNTWIARAPLPSARSHITSSTFVRDGRIITIGGLLQGNRPTNIADQYDPATNTWRSVTSLPRNRLSGVADTLADGRIIFSTGSMVGNTWIGTIS